MISVFTTLYETDLLPSEGEEGRQIAYGEKVWKGSTMGKDLKVVTHIGVSFTFFTTSFIDNMWHSCIIFPSEIQLLTLGMERSDGKVHPELRIRGAVTVWNVSLWSFRIGVNTWGQLDQFLSWDWCDYVISAEHLVRQIPNGSSYKYHVSISNRLMGTGNGMVVAGGWEEEVGSCCLMGIHFHNAGWIVVETCSTTQYL